MAFCLTSLFIVFACLIIHTDGQCNIPVQFQGDFFSLRRGDDYDSLLDTTHLRTRLTGDEAFSFNGRCFLRNDINGTEDAQGNHDSWIVFYDSNSHCYACYLFFYRTPNIIQYKVSTCQTFQSAPTLPQVCTEITEHTDISTFFRKTLVTVNCKSTFEGIFHFSYEWDEGGGGICNSPQSNIIACQEPGSPYVDNQVFFMKFAKCPAVTTSKHEEIKFQCMGTWTDTDGNVWSGVANLGEDIYRNRFRCMLTRNDQEVSERKFKYSMSWWADCSKLKSPYEGPVRLEISPVVGGYQLEYTVPSCNFPANMSGQWFYQSEYDTDVYINTTHIYFKTYEGQYTYKESYFTCRMYSGTRYLVLAVTVGFCEIDYLCLDILPRHQSLIRWRMGRPYRPPTRDQMNNYPFNDDEMAQYIFRQACHFTSFTLDRDNFHWNYKVFMLNPPAPVDCPVRGRYRFDQSGPESELITTRIRGGYRTMDRGVTERPRHKIDCRHYVSEWKSCDESPSKISLDAEYCETLDHTGQPIGEYDEPDWELTCIGHWDEDWNHYMITWDPEDVMSPFRCWNYERLDWRFVRMSRSTRATCKPSMKSTSSEPADGASLLFAMEESERLYDDCAQQYIDNSPFNYYSQQGEVDFKANSASHSQRHCSLILSLMFSNFAFIILMRQL